VSFWGEVKSAWSGTAAWVEHFFGGLWASIKKIFNEAIDWMKQAGVNLVKALGEGILSAAESLAEKIGGYFKFHSPPAYGPLREAIINFRFGEELAKRLQPAPAIGAAAVMAAGIAAAPMVQFNPPSMPRAAAAGGGATMIIHYSPTINISAAASAREEFAKTLRQHSDELVRILRDKAWREQRLRFDR